MTDHVEMLHLLALDARRVEDNIKAKILFEAAEYLNFLQESMGDEMEMMRDALISQIAALETELESLKS
jgi:hypothetical protein